MEKAREIETKRLINQVNNLIGQIEWHYNNLETDFDFDEDIIVARLAKLEQFGNIICANIECENAPNMVKLLAPEKPLYHFITDPTVNIPSGVLFGVKQYLLSVAKLRGWVERNSDNTPQEPKVKRKPGRPRQQNRVFSDYINTKNPEKRDEITTLISTLMDSTNRPTRKLWVIRAALEIGLLGDKPDQRCIESTFDISFSKSTYGYAFNKQPAVPDLYRGYINRLNTINNTFD